MTLVSEKQQKRNTKNKEHCSKKMVNMMITKKEMQLTTESTIRKRKMNIKICWKKRSQN